MAIKIILDNYYNNEYFPGQTILGRIECNFKNEENFQAIRIKFAGKAAIKWIEKKVVYHAKERYLNVEYNLVEERSENITLSAGRHFYPFSCSLSPRLPSSFKGRIGKIEYYIEATVERPWKFNYKAKLPLNIVLPMNLNDMPRLRDPEEFSKDKTMRSRLCRNMGVLTCNLSIPVTGYVPGQEINITAHIQNKSNIIAKYVKFKIVAVYEYSVDRPSPRSNFITVVIVKCVEGSVGAHCEKVFNPTLRLPTDQIYPNLNNCNFIEVKYTLKAEVVLPNPNSNLKLEIPITVGSIALSDGNSIDPDLPQYESLNTFIYESQALPPPYSSVTGECKNTTSSSILAPSPSNQQTRL